MQRNMLAPLGFHSEGRCKRIGVSDAWARDAHIRPAQLCPCLDQCIEDLLQIERRAVDDLQHLRSARWNEEMDERSARRTKRLDANMAFEVCPLVSLDARGYP